MSELLYRIALTKIPKVGGMTVKNLVSHLGSAEAVFRASKRDLVKVPGIANLIATSISENQHVLNWAEKELVFMEKNKVRALFHTDPEYPDRLKQVYDAPALIYVRGDAPLNAKRILSIIGTRKPTYYGTQFCEAFLEQISVYKPLIVSGLAFGIDACAHRKSLDLGLPTVGVMGSGLQKVYPHEHRGIAERMCTEGGALITEYPSDEEPDREHFPMRNRIIAAMCDATIVIETAAKGGSMITAQIATSYGREIFAVPGRITDKYSAGCNFLIKSNQATLLENAAQVAESLNWSIATEGGSGGGKQQSLFVDLTENEQILVDFLKFQDMIVSFDLICYATKLSQPTVAATLLSLEFKNLLKSLPGKRYELL